MCRLCFICIFSIFSSFDSLLKIFFMHCSISCYVSSLSEVIKFYRLLMGSTKHRKGATTDLLNTAKYNKEPDNPKPDPNVTLTLN